MKHRVTCPTCKSVLEVEVTEARTPAARRSVSRRHGTPLDDAIIAAVKSRVSSGNTVSLALIRDSVQVKSNKADFDAACLRLMRTRKLFFQRHDLPSTLDAKRLGECVYDGNYYYHEVGLP